jgi:hypothetical protein
MTKKEKLALLGTILVLAATYVVVFFTYPVEGSVKNDEQGINCSIGQEEGEAFNQIYFELECKDVNEWGHLDFGDDTGTDVLFEDGTSQTEHTYSYEVGMITSYDIVLTLQDEQFKLTIVLDDSPPLVNCEVTIVEGETFNNREIVLECDGLTTGWATILFGDGSTVDAKIVYAEDTGLSRASETHLYAYDPYGYVLYSGSIIFNEVEYSFEVIVDALPLKNYLPVVISS